MKILILFVADQLEDARYNDVLVTLRKAAYESEEQCTVLLLDGMGENKIEIVEI